MSIKKHSASRGTAGKTGTKKLLTKNKSAKSRALSLGKNSLSSGKESVLKIGSKSIDDGLEMARRARDIYMLSDDQIAMARNEQIDYVHNRMTKPLASRRITW